MQCCGSRMIYSGSSYESSEFRILPILFTHIWKLIKKTHTLNSIKTTNIPIICHFLFYNIVLQYTQSRIHMPKIRNNFFCWIRIQTSSGSNRIQIHNTISMTYLQSLRLRVLLLQSRSSLCWATPTPGPGSHQHWLLEIWLFNFCRIYLCRYRAGQTRMLRTSDAKAFSWRIKCWKRCETSQDVKSWVFKSVNKSYAKSQLICNDAWYQIFFLIRYAVFRILDNYYIDPDFA